MILHQHTREEILLKTYKKCAPSKNRLWLWRYAGRPTKERKKWKHQPDLSKIEVVNSIRKLGLDTPWTLVGKNALRHLRFALRICIHFRQFLIE